MDCHRSEPSAPTPQLHAALRQRSAWRQPSAGRAAALGLALLLPVVAAVARAAPLSFDLVITHGRIIDGTGSPWYSGDVGIRNGRIAAIGILEGAPRARTIDAHERVVAPGFIDMLGQSELTILVDPRLPSKIFQGITTEITGEGNSVAPLNDAMVRADHGLYEHYTGTSPEGILGREHPHPRAYATFPRILRKYVREEKKLTLEDAIRKFTALPAQRMRLIDRGVLKAGMWADVVIFDPATIRDVATFDKPNQLSQGMEYVLVNGVPVIARGRMTAALPGKVLRGPGYTP